MAETPLWSAMTLFGTWWGHANTASRAQIWAGMHSPPATRDIMDLEQGQEPRSPTRSSPQDTATSEEGWFKRMGEAFLTPHRFMQRVFRRLSQAERHAVRRDLGSEFQAEAQADAQAEAQHPQPMELFHDPSHSLASLGTLPPLQWADIFGWVTGDPPAQDIPALMVPVRRRDINPLSLVELRDQADAFGQLIDELEDEPGREWQVQQLTLALERIEMEIAGSQPDPELAPGTAECPVLMAQLRRSAVETLAAAKAAFSEPDMGVFLGIVDHSYCGPIDPHAWRTAVLLGAKGKRVTVQPFNHKSGAYAMLAVEALAQAHTLPKGFTWHRFKRVNMGHLAACCDDKTKFIGHAFLDASQARYKGFDGPLSAYVSSYLVLPEEEAAYKRHLEATRAASMAPAAAPPAVMAPVAEPSACMAPATASSASMASATAPPPSKGPAVTPSASSGLLPSTG